MAKVKLGLNRMGPNEVVSLATSIKTAMTGNAKFPSPSPSLADLAAGIGEASARIGTYDALKSELAAALTARDEAVAALGVLLTREAAYVESVSGGDAATIESAGMDVRAVRRSVGKLERVEELAVLEGAREGTLKARWKRLRGARVYEVQTTADVQQESSWVFRLATSRSKATIEELASGARVWVRVRAIGTRNQKGPWSDPAVKTVP